MCTYFNEIQSLGKMVSKRVDMMAIIKIDTREGACTCVTSIGSWWWNNRIIWRFKSNEKLHPTDINRRVFFSPIFWLLVYMSAKLHVYNTAMIRRLTPLYVNLGDPLMRNNITCNKMQGTLSTVCIIFARGYLI